MTFDLQRILESKRAWRRSMARRPVAEKLALLDTMRDRLLAIRGAAARRDATVLREPPPEFRVKPREG